VKEKASTKLKKSKRSELNNSTAKFINIYNELGEIVFECFRNFKSVCSENKLPYTSLYKSYKENNGSPILEDLNGYSKKFINKNKRYIG